MNENTLKNWLKLAEYDFETAEAMLKSGRYLYVAYTCEQTLEKYLKAIYVKEKNITPPYIHNLKRLLSELSIFTEINDEQSSFIDYINSYYIESRYNEEIETLKTSLNKQKATEILNKTRELSKWLKTKVI